VSRWTPCKRRDFIFRLRELGFDGPFSGSTHHFLVYRQHRLAIPSNTESPTGVHSRPLGACFLQSLLIHRPLAAG